MNPYITIKCPSCGAVLRVKDQPGLQNAFLTCPVCKEKRPFSDYKVIAQPPEDPTEPANGAYQYEEDITEPGGQANTLLGCLMEQSGKRWLLHPGVNTVGRKLQAGPQKVEIPVNDYTGQRMMSRSHAKIEVIRLPNGGYKHVLSNWQNKNKTFVNGAPLDATDKIVLHHGMVIRFANVEVRFVIEDSEDTL